MKKEETKQAEKRKQPTTSLIQQQHHTPFVFYEIITFYPPMMLRNLGIRDEMGNSVTGKEFFLSSFSSFVFSFLLLFLHLINEIGRHEIHAINPGGDGVMGQESMNMPLFLSFFFVLLTHPLFPPHQLVLHPTYFFFLHRLKIMALRPR
ncbi:hypothetical protein P168DRAFT_126038 [Aspergillus campestris IBT 28561]|uniref:Uncharacterized protein n=1 Tax=Aspergillus campestris (strain IBT 28561) TaxID=1392248 RepID=A0A2I1D6N8_ASPC2|nr:uncharacterized protein P168DRAFT_126038 [Aspergillus campestris IBT 28561]PKY05527.1 hypothetical protein P168DRAFT_126038 [Aspergillus campestris IBT 28561]